MIIVTDENGSFSQGPIHQVLLPCGRGQRRWYEINATFSVQDEPQNITLAYQFHR